MNKTHSILMSYVSVIERHFFPASVLGPGEPPEIVAPPPDTSTPLVNTLNLTCDATGNPPPTYRWYKDGELLPGAVLPYFYITETAPEDRGYYHCEVTNSIDREQSLPALVTIPGNQHDTLSCTI